VLASTVTFELLESVAGRNSQILDLSCRVQHLQFAKRNSQHSGVHRADRLLIPEPSGSAVPERPDHHRII